MSWTDWQNTPFTVPLLVTGLFCLWVAYVSWQRRALLGAAPLAVLMAAIAGWTLTSLVEKSLVDHAWRYAVSTFGYVFILTTPTAWLVFAVRFARQDRWLPPPWVPLLLIEPAAILLLACTDHYHGLFRAATEMRKDGAYVIMVVRYGPLFWVNLAYTYVLFAGGVVFIVVSLAHRPDGSVGRLVVLVGGMLVPTLGNVAYVFKLQPAHLTDLTPVYFAFTGLCAAWMLFRVRVFDVLPIARDFVMDCVNHAVVVLDNRGQVLDANAVARALLPNQSGRVRHRPLEEVFPELHRRLPPVAGSAGATPEVPLRLAGEERFWDLQVLPIADEGAQIGTLILLTDVTARKHAEAERRRFEEQLRHTQKLESLGVMAGGIAHDFNNLLTVIQGNTELAQERLGPASPAAPLLQNVVKAAGWAAAITNQMLTYAGKAPFVVAPVSLSTLIEGMADLLRAVVPRQVSLEFDLAPDLPPVPADPALLRQVIMNLLSNAAEALGDQPGSVWVRTRPVEVRAEDLAAAAVNAGLGPGSHLLLEVADTGAGMDPATRARMFEPFFTTKFTGRGLGMAVVLGIVRGHGGAIFVHSEVGVGTQVRVVLPRAAGPVPREEPPRPPPVSAGVVRMRSATVLVVDDEEHVRRVAEQFLRLAGYRILTARDGAEALRVHQDRAGEIDVVLLDLTMPDLTGDVVFQKLRERDPELPVILTSGYTEEVVVRQLPSGEPPEFLHKPYRGDELTGKVRAALLQAAVGRARPSGRGP